METRECYRGTQGDFNTHAHSLPPLLSGCYFKDGTYLGASKLVDVGPFMDIRHELNPLSNPTPQKSDLNPRSYPEPKLSREEAAFRVIQHHEKMRALNPYGD